MRATAAWIEGATDQTAAWDVSAVLSTVADAVGDDLLKQILLQLPAGYDLLFGCLSPPDHPYIRCSHTGTATPATERQPPQ